MSSPFTREPLKEFLDSKKETKKESHEDIIFSFILTIFIISTVMFYQPEITGRVVYEETTSFVNISQTFEKSTNISFVLKGNITSIRLSGAFIGNGTGRVLLNNLVIVDKAQLSKPSNNLITGFVVSDLVSENDTLENETNESVEIIEEITYENITLNETKINVSEITNVTLNETITNVSQLENISVNISSNVTTNITLNVTNITIEVEKNITVFDEIIEFKDYCLETCSINTDKEIVLVIELDNLVLNLSGLGYTYITDVIVKNLTQNISNLTTELNETNIAENITLNITNVSVELPNITEEFVFSPFVPIEVNNLLLKNNFDLLEYKEAQGYYDLSLTDKQNSVRLVLDNISNLKMEFIPVNDLRLSSDIFVLNTSIASSYVELKSKKADVVLKCVQFTDNKCKNWIKTDIDFDLINNTANFFVYEPGVYAVSEIKKVQKQFIPTNSVYYNTDCEKCSDRYNCEAENFCPVQNKLKYNYNFIGQFDFDIFNLDNSFEKVEICAYVHYNSNQNIINYIKYSPESFCSDIRQGNSNSLLLSYKTITEKNAWTCMDVTHMVEYASSQDYSNVFMNWLGQDIQGNKFPFTCFRGITSLDNCGGYNPSRAEDCRPYLKLTYK